MNKLTLISSFAGAAFLASSASAQVVFSEDFTTDPGIGVSGFYNQNQADSGWFAEAGTFTTSTGAFVRDLSVDTGSDRKAAYGISDPNLAAGDYEFTIDYSYDNNGVNFNPGAGIELIFETLDWNGAGTNIIVADRMPLNSGDLPNNWPGNPSGGNHTIEVFTQSSSDFGGTSTGSGSITLGFTTGLALDQAADFWILAIETNTPGGDTGGSVTIDNIALTQVPEPSAAVLLLGLGGLGLVFRRRA